MKPNIGLGRQWWNSKSFGKRLVMLGLSDLAEEHGGVGGDMGFDSITVYEQAKTGLSWGYGIQSIIFII